MTCFFMVRMGLRFFCAMVHFGHLEGSKTALPSRTRTNHMGVSENGGTPKSSNLIGISITNHPFWGTPILGNTHMV